MDKERILGYFQKEFNQSAELFKAPGRINIIGEHTDYNLGFVLPASIDKGIYFAIAKSGDNHVRIKALTHPDVVDFDLDNIAATEGPSWAAYYRAILEILKERNYEFSGVNCVFGGDIPIGAGLSSSAALCCGFIYAISDLFDLNISRSDIALMAQEAEHRIGLNCGLMDQYAVLFGKKDAALFLDCKDLSFDYVPFTLDGYSWALINSNIEHQLAVDSHYNDRRKSCENIVNLLAKDSSEIKSLRDVSLQLLESVKDEAEEVDYRRAHYVIEENERVKNMIQALGSKNPEDVGSLLLKGHQALSKEYEVSTSEMDELVAIGQETTGVLGSRMMGGGFGGCTINLIKEDKLDQAIESILSKYEERTGQKGQYYAMAIDDSVKKISVTS